MHLKINALFRKDKEVNLPSLVNPRPENVHMDGEGDVKGRSYFKWRVLTEVLLWKIIMPTKHANRYQLISTREGLRLIGPFTFNPTLSLSLDQREYTSTLWLASHPIAVVNRPAHSSLLSYSRTSWTPQRRSWANAHNFTCRRCTHVLKSTCHDENLKVKRKIY